MLSGGNMEVYSKIMDDIVSKTNGEYENMSYSQKVITIMIMKEIKQQMDRYYKEQYPAVCAWSAIPIESIALNEVTPDLTRFRDNNFQEQFEKLMRGNI